MAGLSLQPHRGSVFQRFLASKSAGGILLMAAAAAAMIVANGPLAHAYHGAVHAVVGPALTEKLGPMTVHLWINDGLMALFFLLVGLEIKRELADGRLATWDQRRLPLLPAAMGMAVPAVIYWLAAGRMPGLSSGWAIPAATDIAFAMAVLALLGDRAPLSLKLFLVSVAIVDDIGAVAIIALFYTASLDLAALAAAGAILAVMFALNRRGVRAPLPYLIGFALLWYATLLSGVHATIAGVLAAFAIPIIVTPGAPDAPDSTLHRIEHALAPWVGLLIVPLFGFANAGVTLDFANLGAALLSPLPLGVALGLFLGKQLGVAGGVLIAVKTGLAARPRGATWLQIYGVAMLCGIGFTMSLFIAGLAFPADRLLVDEAKIGILAGSLVSAIAGCAILRFAPQAIDAASEEAEQRREIAADGDVEHL